MTLRTMEGDRSKLPKWAQRYIESLEREINQQDDHIRDISSQHPGSGVYIRQYTRPDHTLPANTRIRFDVPGPRGTEGYVEVHSDRGRVEVRGSEALIIRPNASNSASVTVGDY